MAEDRSVVRRTCSVPVTGSPGEASDELWAVIEPLLPAHPRRWSFRLSGTHVAQTLPSRCLGRS
jgi:hypothetical protein